MWYIPHTKRKEGFARPQLSSINNNFLFFLLFDQEAFKTCKNTKKCMCSDMSSGACRGMVFGGRITPELTAPGVTPDLTAPPKILTSPYFEAPQNYRKMYLELIHSWQFNTHVYLVIISSSFPYRPRKNAKIGRAVRNLPGAIRKANSPGKYKFSARPCMSRGYQRWNLSAEKSMPRENPEQS